MDKLNVLAEAARNALTKGSDIQFNQLCDELNIERQNVLKKYTYRIPSLDLHDIDSIYMESLWRTTMEYEQKNGEFLQQLRTAIHRNILDQARKTVRYAQRNTSLEKLIEDDGITDIIPTVSSAEVEFMEHETIDDYIRQLESDSTVGPFETAVIRTRIEDGLSANQAVNIAGDIFRNRQQLLRTMRKPVIKQPKSHTNKRSMKKPNGR